MARLPPSCWIIGQQGGNTAAPAPLEKPPLYPVVYCDGARWRTTRQAVARLDIPLHRSLSPDGYNEGVFVTRAIRAAQIGRRVRIEQRLAECTHAAQTWERRALKAAAERNTLTNELVALETLSNAAGPDVVLPPVRPLYVGGGPSVTEQIRHALTANGGKLLVHDGIGPQIVPLKITQ